MGEDFETFVFIILVIILFCAGLISTGYEAIDNHALDDVCKEVTQNETATYYKEMFAQHQFPCKVGNKIIIIDKLTERE